MEMDIERHSVWHPGITKAPPAVIIIWMMIADGWMDGVDKRGRERDSSNLKDVIGMIMMENIEIIFVLLPLRVASTLPVANQFSHGTHNQYIGFKYPSRPDG